MWPTLRKGLGRIARTRAVWPLVRSALAPAVYAALDEESRRKFGPPLDFREALNRIAPDRVVRQGPFAGMRYVADRSVGSALMPKLLGSYERELHGLIEAACSRSYDAVVDIGCAEGYYAVGFARRLPNSQVYAYDLKKEARDLCRAMAEGNDVADRVHIETRCDPEALLKLPLGQRALIVSDCEGFEKELFTPTVAAALADHDLLIEIHDFIDIETSPRLVEVFRNTHRLTRIPTLDDIAKAHQYSYAELDGYDLAARRQLLAENRKTAMEWFFLTPLSQNEFAG